MPSNQPSQDRSFIGVNCRISIPRCRQLAEKTIGVEHLDEIGFERSLKVSLEHIGVHQDVDYSIKMDDYYGDYNMFRPSYRVTFTPRSTSSIDHFNGVIRLIDGELSPRTPWRAFKRLYRAIKQA